MPLLNNDQLERSGVVANCRMNRERTLTGSNGYAREIRIHPLDLLRERASASGRGAWLDLCCGSGRALVEAAEILKAEQNDSIMLRGVDLVGMFILPSAPHPVLQLIESSLSDWEPTEQFDLITCVHGLHYIGDKLGLIARAISWLTDAGCFVANLDHQNLKLENHRTAARICKELRRQGLQYDTHRQLLKCEGNRLLALPFHYLGADDQAGPNSTGQPAVNSHYAQISRDV